MRKNYQKQMPLMITSIDHPHATELEGIVDFRKKLTSIF